MGDDMFTEHTLLADIIAKWGDYGAHADVFRSMLSEIERFQAIVTTVDDLHSPRLAHDTCLACDHNWPCPTHLLIHPEEARREQ